MGMWRYEYASLANAARRSPVAQEGRHDDAAVQWNPGRADPDRYDRLTEGDDDDQPEPFDEVLGRNAPSAHAGHQRVEIEDRQRGTP